MSTYVIWMDLNQAKIFTINLASKNLTVIHRTEIKHHTHSDPENHKDTHRFFQDVAEQLKEANEILLMGPAQTKNHFHAYLEKSFPQTLARAVAGVETMDHPTENQILERSREFFRTHDPFRYPTKEWQHA